MSTRAKDQRLADQTTEAAVGFCFDCNGLIGLPATGGFVATCIGEFERARITTGHALFVAAVVCRITGLAPTKLIE